MKPSKRNLERQAREAERKAGGAPRVSSYAAKREAEARRMAPTTALGAQLASAGVVSREPGE